MNLRREHYRLARRPKKTVKQTKLAKPVTALHEGRPYATIGDGPGRLGDSDGKLKGASLAGSEVLPGGRYRSAAGCQGLFEGPSSSRRFVPVVDQTDLGKILTDFSTHLQFVLCT